MCYEGITSKMQYKAIVVKPFNNIYIDVVFNLFITLTLLLGSQSYD